MGRALRHSGHSWTPLLAPSLSSVVTFKWRDICISYVFSQQTTRDKRRASKEASAVSKDGQSVSLNSSADPEQVEGVWWKLETSQESMKKRTTAGAVTRSAGVGMVLYRTMLASDFCEMLAGDLIDLQHEHLHMFFVQRSWDAASLLCHWKYMYEAESGWQTVFTPSAMLSSCAYGAS